MYTWNYIHNCDGKSSIQQQEYFFHQQTGIQFKEETSGV
jgi:hypothetical protein